LNFELCNIAFKTLTGLDPEYTKWDKPVFLLRSKIGQETSQNYIDTGFEQSELQIKN